MVKRVKDLSASYRAHQIRAMSDLEARTLELRRATDDLARERAARHVAESDLAAMVRRVSDMADKIARVAEVLDDGAHS